MRPFLRRYRVYSRFDKIGYSRMDEAGRIHYILCEAKIEGL